MANRCSGLVFAGVLATAVSFLRAAHAQPTEAPPAATASSEPSVEPPVAPPKEPPTPPASYERWILTTELLGVLAGRYGVQVEYVLTPRDTIAVYGWYLTSETQGTRTLIEGDPDYLYDTRTRAGGIDAQYRRYIGGGKGGNGGFISPGLEFHDYVAETSRECASSYGYNNPGSTGCPSRPSFHEAFSYLGGTLDIGGQAILPVGLTVGGSAGLHYRRVVAGALGDTPHAWSWAISHSDGLRPRLRVWLGWAF